MKRLRRLTLVLPCSYVLRIVPRISCSRRLLPSVTFSKASDANQGLPSVFLRAHGLIHRSFKINGGLEHIGIFVEHVWRLSCVYESYRAVLKELLAPRLSQQFVPIVCQKPDGAS